MNTFEIHNLWPTPIYKNNFEVKKEWLNFSEVIEYENTSVNNGSISIDRYILNKLPDLKKEIEIHCFNYTKKFLKIKNNANFYMQNSWILKHKKNNWAQAHYHTGSLISGVYYLDVPKNSGNIVFQRMSSYVNLFHSTINIEYDELNYINDDMQNFTIKTGDILLFPSHVMHKVRANLSNFDRYSVGFNFFVKGKFGIQEFQLEIN